jgi:hypothetical protein
MSVDAQRFVAILHRAFNARRKELLARRVTRQYEIDAGRMPGGWSRVGGMAGRQRGSGTCTAFPRMPRHGQAGSSECAARADRQR